MLGASSWRVVEITHDRVLVAPAPGEPGKMPFWHGDQPGRPLELGARNRQPDPRAPRCATRIGARATASTEHCLDALAADNLLAYLDDQLAATGAVPDDRTVVVERCRDELGDWRL